MNLLVIRFLLRDGHGVDAYVTKERAKEIIEAHNAHRPGMFSGEDHNGYWSVNAANIVGIRTIVVPQQDGQQKMMQWRSGVA